MSIAPPCNAAHLPQCIGRAISLVGRLQSINQSTSYTLSTTDNSTVVIQGDLHSNIQSTYSNNMGGANVGDIVEVVGLVQNDGSIQPYNTRKFIDTFSMYIIYIYIYICSMILNY